MLLTALGRVLEAPRLTHDGVHHTGAAVVIPFRAFEPLIVAVAAALPAPPVPAPAGAAAA